jgi:hypothetical protein
MGIDFAGSPPVTLTADSGLRADYGTLIMKMGTTGILQRYNAGQPMFRATGVGAAASVALGSSAWVSVVLGSADINTGSCYNTSNGRFTAPVDGVYLVTASIYFSVAATGHYVHPMWWVNGSGTVRRPSAGGLHRMRGYGITGGSWADGDTIEMIPLLAGDYVTINNYCGGNISWIPQYCRLEGYLLA